MRRIIWIYVLVCCLAIIYISATPTPKTISSDEVPYPEGYRLWTHVKTGLIGPANPNFKFAGGYHHVYANEKAMKGYATGKFDDGSVLVFDVLDAIEQNGNTVESGRKHIDVMVKDSSRYVSTGGWGFEEFDGDSHTQRILSTPAKMQCFSCHASRKNNDYVFSNFRK